MRLGPSSSLSLALWSFSAFCAKYPKGCRSVIRTLSRLWIVSPWSLEGVSLLLRWYLCSAARLKRGWDEGVGVKRKSPHRVGLFEFLAAGVSSHYFFSPVSPSKTPQACVWWTGTFSEESLAWKKTKITKEGAHPQSSFHCTGITCIWRWKANSLGS